MIKSVSSTIPLLLAATLFHSTAFAQKPAEAPKAPSARHALDLTLHTPESVGFSSGRLENLHQAMQKTIDDKELAGMVTLLARHGKIVDYRAYGVRDLDSKAPMTRDTIFRDYSMTKPVTAVAMMILYEQGKWSPGEPIAKYIPEFAHLKVYKGEDADGKMILVDPDHPPTMNELMTHTAGFSYGFFGQTPVDRMIRDAQLFQSKDLHEFIEKVARIPLLYQPGTQWVYSISMDIQGYLVEKLSGQSLPDFMRDHIYQPLGMKDAGFYVSKANWSRFATNYSWDRDQNALVPQASGTSAPRPYDHQPEMPSGGGGMVSTIEDYYRFAQMLANTGELNGKRILAPAGVHLMSTNKLSPELTDGRFGIGAQHMRPGFGYGYNCAVEYDPQLANLPDGKGTFLWDGAAGTWFWIDPANDLVFVGMIQRMNGGPTNVQYLARQLVYGALVDPSK